jgi:hypothetical protein
VLFEDFLAPRVDFDLPFDFESGAFESKVKTSNSCKQTAHGQRHVVAPASWSFVRFVLRVLCFLGGFLCFLGGIPICHRQLSAKAGDGVGPPVAARAGAVTWGVDASGIATFRVTAQVHPATSFQPELAHDQ